MINVNFKFEIGQEVFFQNNGKFYKSFITARRYVEYLTTENNKTIVHSYNEYEIKDKTKSNGFSNHGENQFFGTEANCKKYIYLTKQDLIDNEFKIDEWQ